MEGVATRAWVHAEVLSPLQQRIWQLATRIPEAGTVALAGSGGLIVRGLVNRISRDVDLFATSADEIDRFLPALEAALQADGLAVERLRIAWGFASLRVSGMGEETGVDIGIQMRLHPPERTPAGPYCPKTTLQPGRSPPYATVLPRGTSLMWPRSPPITTSRSYATWPKPAIVRFDRQRLQDRLQAFPGIARSDFYIDDERYTELGRLVDKWHAETAARSSSH